jgi:photosystem II stability/assembly factor-like uncharacterized protein
MATGQRFGVADGENVLVLVATKQGLFHFIGNSDRSTWRKCGPFFANCDVNHATFDDRDGSIWVAANDGAARVFKSNDLGASWEPKGDSLPADLVWHVEPGGTDKPDTVFAGVMPAALYKSTDGGQTWMGVDSLNNHETRSEWWEGGGGLCLHTIILPTDRPGRIYAGISVAGLFRSDDNGATWQPVNEGVADFVEMVSAEGNPTNHRGVHCCVHKVVAHPENSDVLFQQNHLGAFRSRDGGLSWQSMNEGLPTDFGFPIAIGAAPNHSLFVIPEDETTLRTPCRLSVWRSRDEGESWVERTDGLPEIETSVLREAMATDNRPQTGVYFGTRDGDVFASIDDGDSWRRIASGLPGVRSVKIAYVRDRVERAS